MSRSRHNPQPLDRARLEELALAYVARFATTRVKLEAYLRRKLRERGWDGEEEPPVAELAERYVAAGYVDDAAYARAKTGSLLRRGYGMRRVGQALVAAGVAEDLRKDAMPGESATRRAALAMARKRGFGAFGREPLDRPKREKQIAAMLRAGHGMDHALQVIDAQTEQAAEDWAAEAMEDE